MCIYVLFNWNGGYSPLSITSNSLLHTHTQRVYHSLENILEYTHSLIITRIHTFPNHTRIHILHSKTIWESIIYIMRVLVKF